MARQNFFFFWGGGPLLKMFAHHCNKPYQCAIINSALTLCLTALLLIAYCNFIFTAPFSKQYQHFLILLLLECSGNVVGPFNPNLDFVSSSRQSFGVPHILRPEEFLGKCLPVGPNHALVNQRRIFTVVFVIAMVITASLADVIINRR